MHHFGTILQIVFRSGHYGDDCRNTELNHELATRQVPLLSFTLPSNPDIHYLLTNKYYSHEMQMCKNRSHQFVGFGGGVGVLAIY